MNNRETPRKSSGVHVGSATILLIFVLLCLISFATLSFVSANADHKLTNKIVDRTTAYYEACNEAEEKIADIDQTLQSIFQNSSSASEYYKTAGQDMTFLIHIQDKQSLEVSIAICYPTSGSDPFYQVRSWQIISEE